MNFRQRYVLMISLFGLVFLFFRLVPITSTKCSIVKLEIQIECTQQYFHNTHQHRVHIIIDKSGLTLIVISIPATSECFISS